MSEQKNSHDSTSAAAPPDTRGTLAELTKLLEEFDTVMLTTITSDGELRSRPMALQKPVGLSDCDVWFVTASDAGKNDEIRQSEHVNVSCLRSRDRAYISISAVARVEQDPAEIKKLWKPDWKIWLPEGADDGAVSLLKLTIHRADYWQPEGGRVQILYTMVKSALKGEPAGKNLPPTKHI